jgi:hypothetical protein
MYDIFDMYKEDKENLIKKNIFYSMIDLWQAIKLNSEPNGYTYNVAEQWIKNINKMLDDLPKEEIEDG